MLQQLLGGIDGMSFKIISLHIVFYFITFVLFSADTLRLWINKYHWKDQGSTVFVANQDENIKTKNITEKIDFEQVAGIMATCK